MPEEPKNPQKETQRIKDEDAEKAKKKGSISGDPIIEF